MPKEIIPRLREAQAKQTEGLEKDELAKVNQKFTDAIKSVQGKLDQIKEIQTKHAGGTRITDPFGQVNKLLGQIETILKAMEIDEKNVPLTRVTFQMNDGKSHQVIAEPLTRKECNKKVR